MIFVTGSTGLIGSHLLYRLASDGQRVRALVRSKDGITQIERLFAHYSPSSHNLISQIEWVQGDVTDYQSILTNIEGTERVFHCAALVGMGGIPVSSMLETNVGGTANVVDASLAKGVKALCHVSSIASLGQGLNNQVDETSEWSKSKGKSIYAISKYRSEMEVWRGMEQGLNAVIVNPSVIIGPCPWGKGTGRIFGVLSKGLPFCTHGVSGYVDVRDVVEGMLLALEGSRWGKRYLLSSGNYPHRYIFSQIAKGLGKRPPFIHIEPWVMAIALPFAWLAGIVTNRQPIVTRETITSGSSKTYYSSKLAEDELGLRFRPIDEAIANTLAAGDLAKPHTYK